MGTITVKNSRGLADKLFEAFDELRDGKTTPQKARAIASLANTIIATKRLELEAVRFITSRNETDDITKPLSLGS